MRLNIITPEGTVLESDEAEHVQVPAANGELGILPGHIAMVCILGIGRIRVDMPGQTLELAASGGYVEVQGDEVIVLAETAEKAEEIDVERAVRARDRAREQLERRAERVEDLTAQVALRRAINRLRVAGHE